jgi:hypothetical protein
MAHGAVLQDCCDPGTTPFHQHTFDATPLLEQKLVFYLVGFIKEEISEIVERILARKDALDRVVIAAGAYGMVHINGIVPSAPTHRSIQYTRALRPAGSIQR